jgi:hypothetical protein
MANFRQYTQCVDIDYFDPTSPIVQAVLLGIYVTLPAAVVPVLMVIAGGNVWCLLLLAEIFLIAGIIGYCYWWLFRRLICIPAPPDHPNDSTGNQMVIGTLIDKLPPHDPPLSSFPDIDNDFCVGILPACVPFGSKDPFTAANPAPGPFGYLITEQPVTKNGVPPPPAAYTGQGAVDYHFKDDPTQDVTSQVLHCEFEGRAIYDMFLAARVAILPVVAALFVCQIPVVGWIIAIALAFLALWLLGIGLAVGEYDQGDPTDISPNLGELHFNGPDHTGADTLMIMGHWVCDAGHRYDYHDLFYELHPITMCCITSPVTDCDPTQVIFLKQRWQQAVNDATSTVTLENQKLPQNQWQIHPIIDGCQPVVIV